MSPFMYKNTSGVKRLKETGKSKKKSALLSSPFRGALQAYLRHRYPTKEGQKELALLVERPFSTISGFIYNGIGGHELQYSLLAASLGLKTKQDVEEFLKEKQAIFLSQSKDIAPSVKLFYTLFNKTDEEILYFFMQSVAINIDLAKEFDMTIKKKVIKK